MQLPGEGAFTFASSPKSSEPQEAPPKDSMSPDGEEDARIDELLGSPMELCETDEKYHLSKEDVEILRWFKDQTVFTIGTAQTVMVYRKEIVRMMLHSVSSSFIPVDSLWWDAKLMQVLVFGRKLGT